MNRLRLFRNLMVMAAADGKMTDEEITFLAERCSRWGITDEQFQAALQSVQGDKLELEIPRDAKARREMLGDMLRMMAADGDLAQTERRLFAIASAAMGVGGDDLDALIDSVVKGHINKTRPESS